MYQSLGLFSPCWASPSISSLVSRCTCSRAITQSPLCATPSTLTPGHSLLPSSGDTLPSAPGDAIWVGIPRTLPLQELQMPLIKLSRANLSTSCYITQGNDHLFAVFLLYPGPRKEHIHREKRNKRQGLGSHSARTTPASPPPSFLGRWSS